MWGGYTNGMPCRQRGHALRMVFLQGAGREVSVDGDLYCVGSVWKDYKSRW